MKHRVSAIAIAAQALSLSLLTGCGGGSSNDPGTPPAPVVPDHAPVITLTAPETAAAGLAFPVTWSADLATSCAADFDSNTATAATVQVTEATAGEKTYSVSCTGTGGTTTETAVVTVLVPAAEGLWKGTIDDNADGTGDRNLAGIVTRVGNYWLLYYNGAGIPAGFYSGTGAAASGAFPSSDLREFNFEGGFAGGTSSAAKGEVTSTYTHPTGLYSTASTLGGSFDSVPVGSPTAYAVTASGARTYAASGLLSVVYSGSWDFATNAGSWAGVGTIAAYGISGSFNQNFTMNEDTGSGVMTVMTGCTDSVSGGACSGLSGVFVGAMRNNSNASDQYAPVKPTATGTSFVPVDGGAYVWSFYAEDPSQAVTDPETGETNKYWTKYDLNVTLALQNLPSIVDANFTTLYDPLYELAPALTTLSGSYTGTAGLNTSTVGGATLVVSDTSVTGSAGACSFSGTVNISGGGGNVYSITALTFTGGACVYAGSGNFSGIARYDGTTKEVVVTATDGERKKGFMFVGTKP